MNAETAKKLDLLPEEYEQIQKILDRVPNYLELCLFSVMWSEECSQKNAAFWLNILPKEGKSILGDHTRRNHSLIDIEEGWAGVLISDGSHSQTKMAISGATRLASIQETIIHPTKTGANETADLSVGIVKVDEAFSFSSCSPEQPIYILCASKSAEDQWLEGIRAVTRSQAVSAMQVIENAGLIAPCAELSVKTGTGMRLLLDPLIQEKEEPEIVPLLTNDFQGSIVLIGAKGQEEALVSEFKQWEFEYYRIGELTKTEYLEFYQSDELVAHIPSYNLVKGSGAPIYQPEYEKPPYLKLNAKFRLSKLPKPKDYLDTARQVFVAAKRSQNRSYFPTKSELSDAFLVKTEEDGPTVALSLANNAPYLYADPFIGALITVAEARRNLVCAGAKPLVLSYQLFFGDPNQKTEYWQFVQAVKGLDEACRKFSLPTTQEGMIRFSQSPPQPSGFQPAMVIGMLGILEHIPAPLTQEFKNEGDPIYMIGTPHNDVGCSTYLRMVHDIDHSPIPRFDLDEEFMIQKKLRRLIKKAVIRSAHDVSEGGLFVSLMECALANGLGFEIETDGNFRKDAYLFGESQGRIIISVAAEDEDWLVNYLNSNNLPFSRLGEVKGENAKIDGKDFGLLEDWRTIGG